jgi:hypothetical protein
MERMSLQVSAALADQASTKVKGRPKQDQVAGPGEPINHC